MVTARPQARSLSVWKALGGAAVIGGVAGVVLAFAQRPPEEFDAQAEALADQVIPTGRPVIKPEDPKAPVDDMMAPDPRSLRGIPPYPGASPRRMMSSRPGADQTMAISWFETGDSVDTVLSFYEQAFESSNMMFTSHRYSEKRGYVSWFEHESSADEKEPVFGKGLMHMVSVSQEGGHTTVMVSATEPQKILENLTPLPAGVRVPPGATPQVLNTSEFGQQRATILAEYQMNAGALATALLGLWAETGWKVVDRADGPLGSTFVVVLNQRQQTVVVDGRGEQAQLFITLEERPPSQGVGP